LAFSPKSERASARHILECNCAAYPFVLVV